MESPRCVRRSHVAHEAMREPQEGGPRGSPLTSYPCLEGGQGVATKEKHLNETEGLEKAAVTAISETPWKG